MEGILRLREIVYQLRKRLNLLEGNVASVIASSSAVTVVTDYITLSSTTDASAASIVIMKQNKQGDFGMYWPSSTVDPANGTTIVVDKTGRKFELVR